MHSLCLCTYTYNDGRLARALLESVQSWTRRPQNLVLVDDGSEPPFTPPPSDCFTNIDLLRLPTNQGVGQAKAAGLGRAAALHPRGVILGMDCDMRLAPDWLETVLPLALRPDVGLVGCPITHNAGNGVVARYLRHFDPVSPKPDDVPELDANFITGCVWLFRSEVWRATNGFDGYSRRTHEDHHFCSLIRKQSLRLIIAGPGATQERRLSRTAMAKRFGAWLGGNLERASAHPQTLLLQANQLACSMAERMEFALQINDPLFIYLEMLLLARLGLACCAGLESFFPPEGRAARAELAQGLQKICAPYPRLAALLEHDLTELGLTAGAAPENSASNFWSSPLNALQTLVKAGIFARLEKFAPLLIEEEGEGADFSFYNSLV